MNQIYRHIDVCLNRIGEGLRVIDEIVRFHLEDEKILKELKEIRHSVRTFFSIPENDLLNSRDSIEDPGFKFVTQTEGTRDSVTSIAKASFKRVIESIRILEEYSKMKQISEFTNINFEKLRQKLYLDEKNILLLLEKRKNLNILNQKVYPITPDFGNSVAGNNELIDYCIEINKVSNFIQLRLKNRSKRELISVITLIKDATEGKLEIIINDHVDLCISENLLGVHLGQDDLPLKSAKKILGDDKIIGVSTHNILQATKPINDGVDYIGIVHIFRTTTKDTGYEPLGLDLLKEINRIPAENDKLSFAIGGVKKENIKSVLNTGVTGVAIISELKSNTVSSFKKLLN